MKIINTTLLLLLFTSFSGCMDVDIFGVNKKSITADYYLKRFEGKSGYRYYLEGKLNKTKGGGVFEGIILKIGWNDRFLVADVKKLASIDVSGWYVLEFTTGAITGPLLASTIKTNTSYNSIELVDPSEIF